MRTISKCFLIIIPTFFINFGAVYANELLDHSRSVYLNNQGVEKLVEENFAGAQQNFLNALKYDRNDLIAKLNIAFTFELMGDREKAAKEYLMILDNPIYEDSEDLFYVYFNLGKVYGDLKQTEQALNSYQKALEFKPDSIEVKTNIELLLQQGGGGGKGDQEQDKEPQDKDGDQPQQPNQDQQQEDKPNPEDLNKNDMQKIFEELKNQEQKIRELEYGEGVKQDSGGKDW